MENACRKVFQYIHTDHFAEKDMFSEFSMSGKNLHISATN